MYKLFLIIGLSAGLISQAWRTARAFKHKSPEWKEELVGTFGFSFLIASSLLEESHSGVSDILLPASFLAMGYWGFMGLRKLRAKKSV